MASNIRHNSRISLSKGQWWKNETRWLVQPSMTRGQWKLVYSMVTCSQSRNSRVRSNLAESSSPGSHTIITVRIGPVINSPAWILETWQQHITLCVKLCYIIVCPEMVTSNGHDNDGSSYVAMIPFYLNVHLVSLTIPVIVNHTVIRQLHRVKLIIIKNIIYYNMRTNTCMELYIWIPVPGGWLKNTRKYNTSLVIMVDYQEGELMLSTRRQRCEVPSLAGDLCVQQVDPLLYGNVSKADSGLETI